MIQTVPFIRTHHQAVQTKHIENVLADSTSFWSKTYLSKCEQWFKGHFKSDVYFLDSCTEAINAVALITDLKPGDEVIVPSFTHVSTVLPFTNQGVIPVFVDISMENLCIDPKEVAKAITEKTRMIISVNYGGWSPDYDQLARFCKQNEILLLEDNAHGNGAYQSDRPLGSFGDFSVFSFERQKNLTCQEGGALIVHGVEYKKRTKEVLNLGTNREAFDAGDVSFFEWTNEGLKSSFTEFQAAYLLPQLESIQDITLSRIKSWDYYFEQLAPLSEHGISLPIQTSDKHNGHVFYLLLKSQDQRDRLKQHLAKNKIESHAHYYPLHLSKYGSKKGTTTGTMINTMTAGFQLLRLPLFNGITRDEQQYVVDQVYLFFES